MVNSRETLKNYCLRALGAPVIQINVAEEQLEDRIDEAIQYCQLYHYDGITRTYFKHQLTEENITDQQIAIPDHIYGVKRISPLRDGKSGTSLFDVQYQLRLTDIYEMMNTNVTNYVMTMQHLAMLDQVLNGYPQFEFNYLKGYLQLEIGKHKLIVGDYILVESYSAVDPTTSSRFWNDPWFKRYVEAQFKKQWGSNLKKFTGLQIPGGATIDGQSLFLEATQEIKDLEEELVNKSAPLGFIVG